MKTLLIVSLLAASKAFLWAFVNGFLVWLLWNFGIAYFFDVSQLGYWWCYLASFIPIFIIKCIKTYRIY